MKYGREYSEALASNEFPTDWVSAAVSYRALKKCIKQVQLELEQYGLDAETLKSLSSSFRVRKTTPGATASDKLFNPELRVAVDRTTGQFLHAGLTDTTKEFLHRRKSQLSLHGLREALPYEKPLDGRPSHRPAEDVTNKVETPPLSDIRDTELHDIEWKQIPLTAVTTFFASLDPTLASLESVQASESDRLKSLITSLGTTISEATSLSETSKSKTVKVSRRDLRVWRQLFELYLETPIFFSSYERDHGSRTYSKAKAQLQIFSDRLVQSKLTKNFRNPSSKAALASFVAINLDILRIMRFEEMNALAIRKILKKFDKRTSLTASASYRSSIASGPLARSIAKDMCAEIATNVLVVVPQLDDYLCPICCELAWKPIKLGCCSAVYCIRCIIKLQKTKEDRCPMCRTTGLIRADASRIDIDTLKYLEQYFPKEVRIKQAANERAAGIDLYGPDFYKNRCILM